MHKQQQARKALEGLRTLTLLVAEHAVNFREQIKTAYYLSGVEEKYKDFPILYDGVNYLAKMSTDTGFLVGSEYSKLFNISKNPDPFLLAPATPYTVVKGMSKRRQLEALKVSPYIELPIPVAILRRIKAVEPVLLNEPKVTQKGEPMSEKKLKEPRNDILDHMLPNSTTQNFAQAYDSELNRNYVSQRSETETREIQSPSFSPDRSSLPSEPSLLPLNMTDCDVPKFLGWYQAKVSEKFIKSYSPLEQLLEKTQTGYNPIWLCYASERYAKEGASRLLENNSIDNAVHGFAVFHIDPASQIRSRVLILHASVSDESTDPKKLPEFLRQLMEYIWKNVNCDEIRIELSHFTQEDGKLAAYSALKDALQELKFRWKTLISDQEGNRVVVLGANRPENMPFEDSLKAINCKNEPITFKHAVVFSLSETETAQKKSMTDTVGPHSLCSYLEALKSFIKKSAEGKCELDLKEVKDQVTNSLVNAASKLHTIVDYYIV
eukprot:TRINITY_DN105925_c0_g1_i1.p1 TRINITY_DN105925_c0_g1~~TRINITY_DN105925_c0_g1_i1.p1  ORF type:complete len:493 (-),score=44.28 TRINITY_DN105925_c0_g1_i1:1246-2724(-)